MKSDNISYIIGQISSATNIPICILDDGGNTVESFNNISAGIHCWADKKFTETLIKHCKNRDVPDIYAEDDKYYYCLTYIEKSKYMAAGPVSLDQVTHANLHEYCKKHNIEHGSEGSIRRMNLDGLISFSALLFYAIHEKKCRNEEILKQNTLLNDTDVEKERTLLSIEQDNVFTVYHHSYKEELLWLSAIRRGSIDEAEEMVGTLINSAGQLSSQALRHYMNIAVTAISLAARAAMEGGVAPSDAYMISDVFINQLDKCGDIIQVYNLIKESSREYASRVYAVRNEGLTLDYAEYCKKYIEQHYNEKLTLETIANAVGVNKNYLTHMFSQKENMTMREYINRVRINHAAKLLRYSQLPIAEISERLCFSSQSHFGELFKKYAGVAPQQYRKSRHVIDITEPKNHEKS